MWRLRGAGRRDGCMAKRGRRTGSQLPPSACHSQVPVTRVVRTATGGVPRMFGVPCGRETSLFRKAVGRSMAAFLRVGWKA